MDVDLLNRALDNDSHQDLMQLTTENIQTTKREILEQLHLPVEMMREYVRQLREYRYVENMDEIKTGHFVRWIDISNPQEGLWLTKGAFVSEVKVADDGVFVVMRNFARQHFAVKLDETLVFQKLSNQEKIILAALDYTSQK